MSAVEDVDKALSFVLGKLAEATEQLSTAQAALEESGTGLSVLDVTNDDEAQQALVYQQGRRGDRGLCNPGWTDPNRLPGAWQGRRSER
ncbi:hypothetical protein [Saccharopolyspora sp. ASAGF58]|uniref:hypothetical protein n=1 Tax=Saccharopolyspora sp. ASAGF58 TaxID=2719023 RepID=UPI0014403205|nr:hypothetical protein [Saccharopolyspora sp. ASAGF58]QIZ38866.1 hypothetical protein FDZ84_35685 [Saccharopolyspora sp. ASAGF58]